MPGMLASPVDSAFKKSEKPRVSKLVGALLVLLLVAVACSKDDGVLQSASGSTVKPAQDVDRNDGRDHAPQMKGDFDAVAGLTEAERAHLVKDADTTWDVTYTDDTTLVAGDALRAV